MWPIVFLTLAMLAIWSPVLAQTRAPTENFTYSRFLSEVDGSHVKSITIAADGRASGVLADGGSYATVIPQQAGSALLDHLALARVEVTAEPPSRSSGTAWVVLGVRARSATAAYLDLDAAVPWNRRSLAGRTRCD